MDLKKISDDQILQAVIFAESFDAKFGPLTLSTPKTLMPLVNRPMLAYTLDMLARSSIQETFIFCNQYAQLIKDFVKEYQQKLSTKMNIQVFVSEEYTNMGAAIRDLDAKGVIKSNFVLLNGDCIGNLQLNELIDIHKRNVKNDPGCIMTTVFRKASPNHRIRSADNEIALLLDFKQKIVFLENNHKNKQAEIPLKLLNETDVSVHFDLIDTHISICSDKVPPDFSDNFDFENRDDFINGLLADDELLQHYIYAHILDDGYATCVSDVTSYDSISRDIIQRFSFPIVPDQESDCSYRRFNVYLNDDVKILNKTEITQNVTIGRNTSIGSSSSIGDSVIGKNCTIGSNVNIKNSYIWDNVTVEDNCSIEKSIIASKVVIGKGTCIAQGCIIANDVVIDENMRIKEFTCLVNDDDSAHNKEAVGEHGKGFFFEQQYDSDNESDEIDIWCTEANEEDDASSVSTSFSDSSDDESCDSPAFDEFNSFFNEVYDSLQRGIEEKLIAENLILEINSSKHAYNVPMNEVNSLVLKAILKLTHQAGGDFLVTLKEHMKYMLPVIQNYIRSDESQKDCIYSLEEFYLSNDDTIKPVVFVKILQYLYDKNVLSEETILPWFNEPDYLPEHEVKDQKRLRGQKELILFTKWLSEAEEESDSDSD